MEEGSARRKAGIYTQNYTNTELTYTDTRVSSGIRTHDPIVQAGEDSSCLRPRGHCDRRRNTQIMKLILDFRPLQEWL
jgi:hypothetical protein